MTVTSEVRHAGRHRLAVNPQTALDVERIRQHFDLARSGRIVTNNAASTQPPRQLLDLYRSLTPQYENVHRGQSTASQRTTELFEASYDTIANWLNAPSRRCIATYRNATEAHNAVMYSLLTEFRDGDNVVTTMMEHNSNFVPWYALCREILPQFGRRVECRVARFDRRTGELDLAHLASLVDSRTKLVCCTGASNFLGTKPPIPIVRDIANGSGYLQPNGERRSRLLVDGAQLVPTSRVDVRELDVDYLSFSFHKFMAPFGVGVLYAKEHLLEQSRPFLYGGDMIADGGSGWITSNTTNCPGSTRPAHRMFSASSFPRRHCGWLSIWLALPDPARTSAPTSRYHRPRWPRPCPPSAPTPGSSPSAQSTCWNAFLA
jgi:cysteine desulfurase/selenocysteine lyase